MTTPGATRQGAVVSTFRESIRFKIRHHEMSDKEAAKALSVSASYLSDLLSGRRKLSAEMALKLERVFYMNAEAMVTQQALDDLAAVREAMKP